MIRSGDRVTWGVFFPRRHSDPVTSRRVRPRHFGPTPHGCRRPARLGVCAYQMLIGACNRWCAQFGSSGVVFAGAGFPTKKQSEQDAAFNALGSLRRDDTALNHDLAEAQVFEFRRGGLLGF